MAVTLDLDDLTLGDDGCFSVVAERRTTGRPRRRLVGARPERPPPADAPVLVRLDPRGRRARRHRPARRRRRRHDARGDRAPLLAISRSGSTGTITFDMELVRYYREHHGVNKFMRSSKIDEHGRPAPAGVLRRHPRDRRRRGADPRDPAAGEVPLLAGAGRRRPLLHRRLGEPAVEPQRRAGAHRPRRAVPRRHLPPRPGRAQLARQGRLPVGDHPDALEPRAASTPTRP